MLARARHGIRGQGDDGNAVFWRRECPDPLRRPKSIKVGHLDIHQHHVECILLHRLNRRQAVADNPRLYFVTLLNSLTLSSLYFIVASGFSLIFGLMRVVNMAHGSFYLLGGYIAYEVQQKMNPESQGFSTQPFQTSTWEWVLPLLVTVGCIALFGLGMQQLMLRWNQGQDLRQALITIAVSVIVADQVIAHFPRTVPAGTQQFGGNAVSISWPGISGGPAVTTSPDRCAAGGARHAAGSSPCRAGPPACRPPRGR